MRESFMSYTHFGMTIKEAVSLVRASFPFRGYFGQNLAPWIPVGETVSKYLMPGDLLLDFGSGSCDKTTVAQVLGVQCSAVDDSPG